MTANIPSRPPLQSDEYPTPAERMHGFRVGELVRITTKLDEFTGRTGVVDMITDGRHGVHVALDGRALAYRPDELERVETSGGGAVPSPAPPSDPTDPASVGEVLPITPADIPGLYVVSEGTAVRPPDSARHRASSQAGLQSMKYAMDATHRAIDAGLAESRRLGDLDAAAQAIVDAADVWADAEGDVDATLTLSEAVQAWRAVRDGGRA